MKKLFLLLIIVTAYFLNSCEEDFSPFGEFTKSYVLTSILRGDSTLQVAAISSSFYTGTLNPGDDTSDHSIRFADVRIWYGDSVYLMSDTLINNNPSAFYVTNRFKITPNKPIEIEALLQNGRRLRAASVTPSEINFSNNSSVLIPPVSGNILTVFWDNGNDGAFYLPKLFIRYSINEGGSVTHHKYEIPLYYTVTNGSEQAYYPPASNKKNVVYNMEAISRSLERLSELISDKSSVTIYQYLSLELIVMDENLTRYVSSTSQSFETLTIRINESDYSNVEGGFGLFGSYIKQELIRLRFQPHYVQSFGYNYISEN